MSKNAAGGTVEGDGVHTELLAGIPVRVRGRGYFWDALADGSWEPQTVAALTQLVGPGTHFADIGAWVGPIALLAAARGAMVEAYEPDPVALDELGRNLELNPELSRRIAVHPCALSDHSGHDRLSTGHLGDTGSSLVRTAPETVEVEVRDVRTEAATGALAGCDFIMADIEGAEYLLIPASNVIPSD